jgi:hypothetical protein
MLRPVPELLWRRRFVIVLSLIALAGALLRFTGLSRQMIMGDEWHALGFAREHSAITLFTTYFPRATSIPNNVYLRLLLDHWGWSELGIRMPSVLATLATFGVLPWLVFKRYASPIAAVVATFLFAISNFWIFYGQNSRPYAPLFLLLLLSLYYFEQGLRSRRLLPWLLFAAYAALGVYFHLYLLPAIAPLCLVGLAHQLWCARLERDTLPQVMWRISRIAFGFGLWTCLVGVLFALPIANGMLESFPRSGLELAFGGAFFHGMVRSLTGSPHTPVAVLLCVAALVGVAIALPRRPLFIASILAACVGSVGFLIVQAPYGGDNSFVMLRYNLALYLLYFVGNASLCSALAERLDHSLRSPHWRGQRVTPVLVGASFLGLCAAASTLPLDLRYMSNNFRQHGAFHELQRPFSTERIYLLDDYDQPAATNIPDYYATLSQPSSKPCRIIEYPFSIGDDQLPNYFYQLKHGCMVFAGFSKGDTLGLALNATRNSERLRFRQLIDVDRAEDVERTRARYLIVHVDRTSELRSLLPGAKKLRARQPKNFSAELSRTLRSLKEKYGEPTHSDELLTVFDLHRRGS